MLPGSTPTDLKPVTDPLGWAPRAVLLPDLLELRRYL